MSRLLPSQRIATLALLLAACPGGSADTDGASESAGQSTGGIDSFPTSETTGATGDASTGEPAPTTSGDDASAGSSTGDFVCLADDIVADVKIPRVMLVLDKSGSMVSKGTGFWDADGDDADGDGCSLNNRYWVFLAALTNVEFHVTVYDTWTETTKLYDNVLGVSAAARRVK